MPKITTIVLVLLSFVGVGAAASTSGILEKKFSFPPPVQWKAGNVEVSLVAVAWGHADSPAMIARGHTEYTRGKPAFFPDRSYALALELQAKTPGSPGERTSTTSRLVLVKDVGGDLEGPMELTDSGFVPGTFDIQFNGTTTTEFWDFFPVSPHQKEFLFQSFAFSSFQASRGSPQASFRVLIRHNNLAVVNALPGPQTLCADFTESFSGTVGSNIQVSLRLTQQGTTLSGTEQYAGTGKSLWLQGRVDSFGNFSLQERYPKDHMTGIFKGTFSRSCSDMTGYFSKPDGSRLLPFEFHEGESNK